VIERLRRIDEANTMRNTALAASLALTAMMVGLAPAANAACSTQTLLTPNIGAIGSRLFSISGLAANDLWSVGTHNNTLYGVRGMILHYDGTAWTVVDKPTMPMESVTEINPNDVWALAGAGALQLEHWNGSSWTVVQVAPPDRGDTAVLNGVSGDPAQLNELWTVGSEGPRGLAYDFAFAEKWDGHGWSKFKPPGGINTGELLSVSETNDGRAWAVGDEVDPNLMSSAVIDHWNGTQWIRVPAAELGGSLTSVAAIADNDVWAAGFGNSAPIVEHWNGTRWSKSRSRFLVAFTTISKRLLWRRERMRGFPESRGLSIAATLRCRCWSTGMEGLGNWFPHRAEILATISTESSTSAELRRSSAAHTTTTRHISELKARSRFKPTVR
jgi:hypothetical protein